MAEAVYDASFIGYANCSLEEPTPERREFLRQLVDAIVLATSRRARVRWNKALLHEYRKLVSEKKQRNDVIDQFFALLASGDAIMVDRGLRSFELARATECGWPVHDRHIIAAAIDGDDVTVHVTEALLGKCASKIWKTFGIRVSHVPVVLPDS